MNDITSFALSRPFHKGKKDKDNEFAVSNINTVLTLSLFPDINGTRRFFRLFFS